MRIPTYSSSRHQADLMNRQMELLNRLQTQIQTGNKLIDSSDDPVLARTIKMTNDYIDHIQSYTTNIVMGMNRTKLIESAIDGSINSLSRAGELVKSAQSDTKSNSDRASMALELQGILDTLVSQVNTRDTDGNYLFSGMAAKTESFSLTNGSYTYNGSMQASYIETSSSSNVVYNENGQYVFGEMREGNGIVTVKQGTSPNQGTAEVSIPTMSNPSAYHGEQLTISFVTNSAGEMAYQVVGSISGQVIPPPPATIPADAPAYKSGMTLSFSGMNMTIQGTPKAGDTFEIAPAGRQNILETLRKTIDLLKTPINNDSDKAAYHQQLANLSESLTGASHSLSGYLSEVGYRERELDNIQKQNDTAVFNQKEILSKLQSVDQAEVISDYYGTMNALKTTQESYSKLRDFFEELFKYIV